MLPVVVADKIVVVSFWRHVPVSGVVMTKTVIKSGVLDAMLGVVEAEMREGVQGVGVVMRTEMECVPLR